MLTEKSNPNTSTLDQMDTMAILRLMNEEDRSVTVAVQNAITQIAKAVDVIIERLSKGGRLLYVGAGTSGRLGILDAVECVPTFGVSPKIVQGIIAGGDRALIQAVEGAEDDFDAGSRDLQERNLSQDDVVIGIAASGRTPYVLGATEYARNLNVATIGISCNNPAPLLEAVDVGISVVVGAEVLTGSTRLKAGTAQKLVLNMISTATFTQLGKVYDNLMVDVQVTNQKLYDRARGIIETITGVGSSEASDLLKTAKNNVKIAIVIHECQVDYLTARNMLMKANGNLREVIEN